MTNRFKTYEVDKDLKVILYNPFQGWGKFTLLAYFSVTVVASWLLFDKVIVEMIHSNHFNFMILLLVAGIILIYGLVVRAVLRSANEYEVLTLSKNELILQKGLGWFKTLKRFNIKEIEGMQHIEQQQQQQQTDHPLKTESFDYLGFQTEQKVVDSFHKNDRIVFSYKGMNYSFGKDIMSWEFESLLDILQTKVDFDLDQIK